VPERGLAALAAALTAWWLCGHLLTRAPLTPVLLGLIAAVAVLVAPRLAAASLFVVFAVLAVAEGRPGGALVLAVLAVATVIALAGAGRLWAAPAGAAALGLLGLGTAWPAVAGMSGGRIRLGDGRGGARPRTGTLARAAPSGAGRVDALAAAGPAPSDPRPGHGPDSGAGGRRVGGRRRAGAVDRTPPAGRRRARRDRRLVGGNRGRG
jgi:hypothetical protein